MTNESVFAAINGVSNCQFFSMVYMGNDKFPQKSGLAGITKVVSVKGCQYNYNYQTAVNNRLEKQGDSRSFTAQSLPWGSWFEPNKVIEHKGSYYLRYYTTKATKTTTTYFEADGTPCSPARVAAIAAWKAANARKPIATQSAAGLDDNQVDAKCVAFANIVSITINGNGNTTPSPLAA